MTDSRAVLDIDRLPWLADERRPKRRSRDWTPLLLAGLLAAVLVAAVSYWLGTRSVEQGPDRSAGPPRASRPAATVTLPEPVVAPPAEQVRPAPMPEVEPAPLPPVRIPTTQARPPKKKLRALPRTTAPAVEETAETSTEASKQAEDKAPARVQAPAAVQAPRKLQYWPASESAGAAGRAVRIGTFYTRLQAKKAWWRIVKVYPGMKRMNATVVAAPSLRNGRTFYRLQFGTTSQAHSEILCQRMRIVGQSCVVVGLRR